VSDTWQDVINASMGRSQDVNADDYQSAMGGGQIAPGVPIVPGDKILFFADLTPLQFSDNIYLEWTA